MLKWLRRKHGFRYWLTIGASIVLALVFLTSGLGKLLGQSPFLLSIPYPVFLAPILVNIVNDWLPWGELILGLLLIMGIATQITALLSIVLVASFIFHNSWMVSQGMGYEPCACFGLFTQVFQGKLSTIGSLYVDIGLFILALSIYFGYEGRFFNLHPWFLGRGRKDNQVLTEE